MGRRVLQISGHVNISYSAKKEWLQGCPGVTKRAITTPETSVLTESPAGLATPLTGFPFTQIVGSLLWGSAGRCSVARTPPGTVTFTDICSGSPPGCATATEIGPRTVGSVPRALASVPSCGWILTCWKPGDVATIPRRRRMIAATGDAPQGCDQVRLGFSSLDLSVNKTVE